jgi:hypothetical protein
MTANRRGSAASKQMDARSNRFEADPDLSETFQAK